MSCTYSTTLKNTRMACVTTELGAAGYIEILTAGSVLLATIPLANPAAPAPSAGVLTFTLPLTVAAAAATGTAALARCRKSGATDVITGLTVGTSAADIILSSTAIVAGAPVTLNSATITHG